MNMKYTNAEIRAAILRAADSIESDRGLWDYRTTRIGDCGTPMCAAGWIAFHLGIEHSISGVGNACRSFVVPGVNAYLVFEDQMDSVNIRWRKSANDAVSALRAYADKYFPAESRALVKYDPSYLK